MKSILVVFSVAYLFCSMVSPSIWANDERIPLQSNRRPSDDLVYNGSVLTAEEAWRLQNQNSSVDLSQLNPLVSEVWNPEVAGEDVNIDELDINSESTLTFKGTIASNKGLTRFNGQLDDASGDGVYTVVMSKTLHTALLRRNILRKLGFVIPAMKYLSKVNIKFANKEERDYFLTKSVPQGTYGTPNRWLGFDYTELKDDQLTLTLNDVMVLKPKESDHINVAMGVLSKTLTSRTLRSLIVPYALMNLGESVNKFPWKVGKIDNEYLTLPQFFATARFNATMDDVLWMARKVEKLTDKDYQQIVANSHFPAPVAKIVVEKIKSRRNSLLEILKIKTSPLAVNFEPEYEKEIKKGQLVREEWKGYASRFAHGDPDSPFKGFQYFAFSKIQNSILSDLLSYVNSKLSKFDPNEKRFDFFKKQFQDGLDHYVQTGEFKQFGVGTWFSPTLDGKLIMSRDIVVGNYLGTDNLVQLADTIGVGVSLGGVLGIENLMDFTSFSINGQVSAVRTYTHLKPVKTLKASFKEPYRNMIVPLIKRKLAKKFEEMSAIKDEPVPQQLGKDEKDPRIKEIEGLLEEINKGLGVGETLLITDRITPQLLANGGASVMSTKVSLSAGVTGVYIKRLQIYRKDASTIQIYQDKGLGRTLLMSVSLSHYIPILRYSQSQMKGKYKVKLTDVDITSDLSENPHLFTNALGLYQIFDEGSSEVLEVNSNPYTIEGGFKDNLNKYSLLVWKAKYLKGDLDLKVTPKNGKSANFVVLNKESQSGINYQAFVTEVLNYYMGQWFKDKKIIPSIAPETYKNPGQSIFGVSETQGVHFEARERDGKMELPLLSLESKKEGWSASKKRLKKYIEKINKDFGYKLFDERDLDNAKGLKLFNISVNINIYDKGIAVLRKLSDHKLYELSRRYSSERRGECRSRSRTHIRTARSLIECGNLNILRDKNKTCKRMDRTSELTKDLGGCLVELAQQMKKDLEFSDFISLIGKENLYIYGSINGFRADSEILNDPIPANTLGHIQGKYWNGPVERVKEILGIQSGEFNGFWLRETL